MSAGTEELAKSSTDLARERIQTNLINGTRDRFGDRYDDIILAQYSLYVEMADRISARRHSANSYFLTVNSLLVALSGFLASQLDGEHWTRDSSAVLIPLAGIVLCFVWYYLIRSYRQLNTAKFKVVHEIESLLPLAPYDAEWEALERGENRAVYWPFTHVEKWVPFVFGTLYVGALVFTVAGVFGVFIEA